MLMSESSMKIATEYRSVMSAIGDLRQRASSSSDVVDLPPLDLKPIKAASDVISLSVASAMRVTDAVRGTLEVTQLMNKTQSTLGELSSERGGQEVFILSLALSGIASMERLRGSASASLPFASSICHGGPWTATKPSVALGLQPSLLSTRPQDPLTRGKVCV